MKKKINVLVRILVMAAIFVITIYLVNIFQNRSYKNLAAEMKDAELPLASQLYAWLYRGGRPHTSQGLCDADR